MTHDGGVSPGTPSRETVVVVISIAFAVFVGGPLVSATDNPTPLAITGATGILLLSVSWWVLGRPSPRTLVSG